MGSLMAGWNCPVLDPETARLERNRSLTNDEIDSFWKLYRKSDEELLVGEQQHEALSPTSHKGDSEAVRLKKSLFWQQLEQTKAAGRDSSQAVITCGDWWTRSNWAFLNEPPLDEVDDASHKYTAQFHVAEIAAAAATKSKHT